MRRLAVCVCLMASASGAAENFYLVDTMTHAASAPVTFTNGAQVTIGTNTYVIRMSGDNATTTEAYMRNIVFPIIDFRDALIPDVMRYFIEMSRGGMNEQRLNFVVNSKRVTAASSSTNTVTLQLWNVSLFDALTVVCQKTGITFVIDSAGVVVIADEKQKERPTMPSSVLRTRVTPPAAAGGAPRDAIR